MRSLLPFLFLLLVCSRTHAATKTAVANNDQGANKGWQNPNNWLPTGVPQSGDIAVVPLGKTITVKGSVYAATAASLTIYVYGTLDFDPSGKLNLSNLGVVQLFTALAKITTNGSFSEQIVIGGGVKYNGQNDGIITGPAFTSSAAPNSLAGTKGNGFTIGVLPLKLLSFTGAENSGTVAIRWSTEEESGIASFDLQRSSDGSVWETLATTASQNKCHCPTSYAYEDQLPKRGMNYYRLQYNHTDGTKAFSPQLVVNIAATGKEWTLHYNAGAARLQLYLDPAAFAFPVRVQLVSATGQMIETRIRSSYLALEVSALPRGLMVILVKDQKGKQVTIKQIKE